MQSGAGPTGASRSSAGRDGGAGGLPGGRSRPADRDRHPRPTPTNPVPTTCRRTKTKLVVAVEHLQGAGLQRDLDGGRGGGPRERTWFTHAQKDMTTKVLNDATARVDANQIGSVGAKPLVRGGQQPEPGDRGLALAHRGGGGGRGERGPGRGDVGDVGADGGAARPGDGASRWTRWAPPPGTAGRRRSMRGRSRGRAGRVATMRGRSRGLRPRGAGDGVRRAGGRRRHRRADRRRHRRNPGRDQRRERAQPAHRGRGRHGGGGHPRSPARSADDGRPGRRDEHMVTRFQKTPPPASPRPSRSASARSSMSGRRCCERTSARRTPTPSASST